ncbi:4-hydroxy-tetrahydrodipicolinate synthase [Edaphobacillus lindanitolerans]|uniref:4-hydroxy-tetrahydrodipicolinate synthase n=1 Tax=Edaphobacillus lindanitolerans TaxID=550447 RepID=A0A1U7PP81_9BACI|nr:4-hydroxy-tetrahydrodipicolinate synthase [Edaphobacillus lindanitolerans]SIT80951.1 dihydrodipicolinate synthase [Edaphobacillus lindanitolerans]
MSHLFTGIAAAVTTPFNGQEVDYVNYRLHLEYLIHNRIQALVINGTTGEGSTLTPAERRRLLEIAVETSAGRVPVIAGTGSNSTLESIESSREAKELGADGIMLITPYYNKTSQRGLIRHFEAIVEAAGIPALLYNVPSRTGMTIEPETVLELSRHPMIVGLKDATGDLNYMSRVRLITDPSFAVYSGNDDTALPFLSLGGNGVISVVANIVPDEFQEMFEQARTDLSRAQEIHYRLTPLIAALSVDVNPIPIKVLTSHLGFGNYEVRLPLLPLDADGRGRLIRQFESIRMEV